MLAKNTEDHETFDTDEKDKTLLTGKAVTKRTKNSNFPTSVGSAWGSASF